ncbi:hypothetical protein NK8_66050 (plasmid) [Caballeronia sp. NK8]|nr:hypothetical protein NK8_66050 [Caballeronia sp. NK8]
MPEHRKEQITGQVHLHAEKVYRFGDCLIDGLVETDHVIFVMTVVRALVHPQSKYARTQGAIFGNHLANVKAASRTQQGVRLCSCLWSPRRWRHVPFGSFNLIRPGLGRGNIFCHGLQYLLRMVP